MNCYYCGLPTDVVNSRPQKRSNQVWRRRYCVRCTVTFTSIETPVFSDVFFVTDENKNPEDYEPFSRDKLFLSIYDAVKHRKTAVADAGALTRTVLGKFYPHLDEPMVDTQEITAKTLEVLKRFDKAAATHYRAFHP